MATYRNWLAEQEGREDAVGWFARYWRDLAQRPRLQAPASITQHLEQRGLFQQIGGLTEAHDAAMAEFRRLRDPNPLASVPGQQEPLPGMPDGQSLVGQAVERATQAGMTAAQQAAPAAESPGVQVQRQVTLARIETLISVILRKLERVERALGLETDAEGDELPPDWPQLYAAADMTAEETA